MEIDKLQLLILTILEESKATIAGRGMTLREIADKVSDSKSYICSQITVNRKVWQLREVGYVDAKIKSNKADLYFITAKGKEMRNLLLSDE